MVARQPAARPRGRRWADDLGHRRDDPRSSCDDAPETLDQQILEKRFPKDRQFADKIPGIAKGLGSGMRQLKDATEDIKREIQKSAEKQGIDTKFVDDIKNDINDVKDNLTSGIGTDIKKEVDQVKKSVDDVTGTIKRS